MRQLSALKEETQSWRKLEQRVKDLTELVELSLQEEDVSLEQEVRSEVDRISAEVERLDLQLLLGGEYDRRSAIVALHAGAGGTESQDWAEMLLRMYVRWAERRGFRTEMLDTSPGEEAGIKSAMLEIKGEFAYGYLRSEHGVHRLVRLSPYDSDHARHTSFALVEVLPEAIQPQVREGKILAQVALKFLVPVARQDLEDCQRMAAIFAQHHCDTREAGQLYGAWRKGSAAIRKRILDDPELFFKTQRQAQEKAPAGAEGSELLRDLEMMAAIVNRAQRRLAGAAAIELDRQQAEAARHQIDRIQKQLRRIDEEILPEKKPHVEPSAAHHDSGAEHAGSEQTRDRAGAADLSRGSPQSPAIQLDRPTGTAPSREGRTLPATDPGAFREVQGESRASP